MKQYRGVAVAGIFAALLLVLATASVTAAPLAQGSFTRTIASSGTTSFKSSALGNDGLQWPEFPGGGGGGPGPVPYQGTIVNRSQSPKNGRGAAVSGDQRAKSNPELNLSFDGLNHRQQRLANGGNQWSLEPPDQGLCAGNGFVLETVNDVLRVFDGSGNPVTGVIDLNTFYGYAPAIVRATGVQGPFVTDPSCHYDADTQRWFHVILTLDVDPTTGAFTGPNHLDLAVSTSANPTGTWTIYRIPAQDDGTQGTPNHHCSQGPCLGDYPHIGADANGFYITTNEYSLFGPEYKSAQVYALSKQQLASGAANVKLVQFDTTGMAAGNPGFTIWPALSPAGQYATANGGTEYLLSSDAAAEANGNGSSNRIFVWQVTNTSSLNGVPALSLTNHAVTVETYGIPALSNQKAGDFPLGQCLNSPPCARTILGTPDRYSPEVESPLDSNDTRMQQVVYANGKLWGALDTAVTVGGTNKAGIEYFILSPTSNTVLLQGYLALANNNLIYPAIGVTSSGRGVMAFTVVGSDYFPSAGYAGLDALSGAGEIHIAAAGKGAQDGFSGYKAFGNPPRPRWGDYGAAAMDGNSVWIASEYIAAGCTLAQYQAAPFGSCGGTRTALANWATRISKVTP